MTSKALTPDILDRIEYLEKFVLNRKTRPGVGISLLPNGTPHAPAGISIGGTTATPVTAVADPPAPTTLSVTPGTIFNDSYVDVAWAAPAAGTFGADQIWQYEVKFKKSTDTQWRIRMVNGLSTRFDALAPSTSYNVEVRSTTILGQFSAALGGSTTTLADTTVPADMSFLATTVGYRSAVLRWTENTDGDVINGNGGYEIDLADNNTFTTNKRTFRTNSTVLSLSDLVAGQVYYYRGKAFDFSGNKSANFQPSGGFGSFTAGASVPGNNISDGNAPASSPAALVIPGINYLYVTWLPVTNNDPLTYDVHLSSSGSGFTPSISTKVGETTGTFIQIKSLPDGTGKQDSANPLAYGTTYYIKLIARDVDGSAAAGTFSSGALLQVNTADLANTAVTTPKIANLAVGSGQLANLAVTAAKVGFATGGGNLLRNSSFEDDTNADGIPDNWNAIGNASTITTFGRANLAGYIQHGSYDFRVRCNGTAGQYKGFNQTGVQVRATEIFVLSVWMRGVIGSGNSVHMGVDWHNASGTFLSSSDATITGHDDVSMKRFNTGTLTAPTNAAEARPYVYISYGGTTGSDMLFDAIQFEYGDVLTAYAPKPDEILSNTITATEIADNAVTTPKLIANAVVSGKIAAGAVSTEKLTVGSVSENAVLNNGFEDATDADATRAAQWTYDYQVNTASPTYSLDSSTPLTGAKALKQTGCGTAVGSLLASRSIPVVPGETWYIGANVKSSVTTTKGFYLVCDFFTTDQHAYDGVSRVTIVGDVATTTSYALKEGQITVPAGKTFMRVAVGGFNPNVTADYTLDDITARKATGTAQIVDASITNAKIVTLAASKITAGEISAQIITLDTAVGVAGVRTDNYVAQVSTPGATTLSFTSTGGSLTEGTYYYGITASTAAGETPIGPISTITIAKLPTPNPPAMTASGTGGTLNGGTAYYYRLSAYNAVGETLASAEASVTTPTGPNTASIQLSWSPVTGATGYRLYGRVTGSSPGPLKIVDQAGTTYTDTGSVSPSGALPSSNTTATTTNKVTLTWSAVTGASGYKVYGRSSGSQLRIATLGNVLTYDDTGSVTPSGLPPTTNSTGAGLSLDSSSNGFIEVSTAVIRGTLSGVTVAGDMTFSAGTFRSAASGKRTEIATSGLPIMFEGQSYDKYGFEVKLSSDTVFAGSARQTVTLSAPTPSVSGAPAGVRYPPYMQLYMTSSTRDDNNPPFGGVQQVYDTINDAAWGSAVWTFSDINVLQTGGQNTPTGSTALDSTTYMPIQIGLKQSRGLAMTRHTIQSRYTGGQAEDLYINYFGGRTIFGGGEAHFRGPVSIRGLNWAGSPGQNISNVGTAGSTTYTYKVTAVYQRQGSEDATFGISAYETTAGFTLTTTTGNATLSATNYNRLTWLSVPGATHYKIYGRTGTQTLMTTIPAAAASVHAYQDVTTTTESFDDKGVYTPDGSTSPPTAGDSRTRRNPMLDIRSPAGLDNQAVVTVARADSVEIMSLLQGGSSAGLRMSSGDIFNAAGPDGGYIWLKNHSSSLAGSGFGGKGVLMQTGTTVFTSDGSGDGTITWPSAFPNGVLTFLATMGDLTSGTSVVPRSTGTSSTIVRIFTGGTAQTNTLVRVNWIVVGW